MKLYKLRWQCSQRDTESTPSHVHPVCGVDTKGWMSERRARVHLRTEKETEARHRAMKRCLRKTREAIDRKTGAEGRRESAGRKKESEEGRARRRLIKTPREFGVFLSPLIPFTSGRASASFTYLSTLMSAKALE